MKKVVCTKCGSDDVLIDAYARWNPYKDGYELDNVFEYCFCNKCEEECDLEDIEVEDDRDLLVCEKCGGTNVEVKCWADANDSTVIDDIGAGDSDDNWCRNCEEHVNLIFKSQYNYESK